MTNEATTTVQEKQRAYDTLFGGFNLDHNLSAYNELVAEKYNTEIEEPVASNTQSFESYNKLESFDSYQPAYETQETPVHLESYYQPQRQARQTSFRPKIFDEYLQEIDYAHQEPTEATAQSYLQSVLLAEVDVAESQAETVTDNAVETNLTPVAKLNGKGLLAVISFVAVTVLVLALIIVNSIAIASSSARISDLQSTNAQVSAQIFAKEMESASIYATQAEKIAAQVKAPNSGYSKITGTIIEAPAWSAAVPEQNSSFFNSLSKFFGNLFN